MTEGEIPGSKKPSEEFSELISSDRNFSTQDGDPGTEVLPDYVTLNKDLTFVCDGENRYVYEHDPYVGDNFLQTSCTDCSTGNNYVNHFYLTMSKSAETFNSKISAETAPGNHYANLPQRYQRISEQESTLK